METHRFEVIVTTEDDWETAVVQIGFDDEPNFQAWMVGCEYLIRMIAHKSKMPYDEAVKALKSGSKEYLDVMLS